MVPTTHWHITEKQVRRLLRLASPEFKTASYIGFLVRQYLIKTGGHGLRPAELDSYLDGRSITPWLRSLVAQGVLERGPQKFKGKVVYRPTKEAA
jgi:hypothetical protein